jgi:hypothetical protein
VRRAIVSWAALVAIAGCGGAERPSAVDTGAKEAARGFYKAIIDRDWPAAYQALHPNSLRTTSPEQFARRAEAYRRYLKFEPTTVRVPTCEEHGAEATARVELGGSGAARHSFKDAITLRKQGDQWFVVLPASFGQPP